MYTGTGDGHFVQNAGNYVAQMTLAGAAAEAGNRRLANALVAEAMGEPVEPVSRPVPHERTHLLTTIAPRTLAVGFSPPRSPHDAGNGVQEEAHLTFSAWTILLALVGVVLLLAELVLG